VKNAVGLVQSTILDSVPGLGLTDSEAVERNVPCIKYEMKKLQPKGKETVISVVPEVVSPVERGALFPPFHRPPSHSLTRPVSSSNTCVSYSFCLLAQFS
jgi:hypothetical protein